VWDLWGLAALACVSVYRSARALGRDVCRDAGRVRSGSRSSSLQVPCLCFLDGFKKGAGRNKDDCWLRWAAASAAFDV